MYPYDNSGRQKVKGLVVELRRTDVATGITVGDCAHCCNLETEKYLFECSRSIMCVWCRRVWCCAYRKQHPPHPVQVQHRAAQKTIVATRQMGAKQTASQPSHNASLPRAPDTPWSRHRLSTAVAPQFTR